jgi:hypothetical protein
MADSSFFKNLQTMNYRNKDSLLCGRLLSFTSLQSNDMVEISPSFFDSSVQPTSIIKKFM